MNQEHFIQAKNNPYTSAKRQRKTLCARCLKYPTSRLWKGYKPVSSWYDMTIIVYRFLAMAKDVELRYNNTIRTILQLLFEQHFLSP